MENRDNVNSQEVEKTERDNHKSYTPKKHKKFPRKEVNKYLLCIDNNGDSLFVKNKRYPLLGCKSIKGSLKFIIKDENNIERYIGLGSSEAKFRLESEVKPKDKVSKNG